MWTARVAEPFRDDPRFWSSVGASADALLTLGAAGVLLVTLGRWSGAAFAVPVLLLWRAWAHGRASSASARPQFESVHEWRDRERDAVAAALPGAFVRHLRRLSPRS